MNAFARALGSTILVALAATPATGCFGSRTTIRSYYVLHGTPPDSGRPAEPAFPGLVRVRNFNAEDVYDKFQFVVRKNPYELRYSDLNVWAVKPYQMVSDIVARQLVELGTFAASTRELGETRPEWTLDGELRAIEVYDSEDAWFAHLALSLRLTRFRNGERVWNFEFDERKPVATTSFSHAARALSELLDAALARAHGELASLAGRPNGIAPELPTPAPETPPADAPIFVPERRSDAPTRGG